MDTKEIWAGKFGDDYLKRNRVDWQKRIPFWMHIMDLTGARSVFEFGCNAGWNLSAIRRAYPDVQIQGYDVNNRVLDQADWAGFRGDISDNINSHHPTELVFTAGVLIHISPEDLQEIMRRMVSTSLDYVLAIEYEAEEETEIEYQGQSGLLWKRPYGKLYENMGLTLIETGKLQEDVGFDNCRYWLLRK